jgi:peptide/nickel transport system permease protein
MTELRLGSPAAETTESGGAFSAAGARGSWLRVWGRLFWRRPALLMATSILLLVVVICAAAPLLPLADPLHGNILDRYKPPLSPGYPLGADQLGRDVLSRLVWGGRISIATGIAANLIVTILGVSLGLLAGYHGGKLDGLIMRLTDILLAFPGLLLTLTLLAFMGVSLINAVIAIIISSVPGNVRFVRGQVVQARQMKFVEAARILGYSNRRIMFGEILPYIMPLILTLTALHATTFFLATASLSIIGLGITPPEPDWGSMVGQGISAIYEAPHALLAPTIMLTLIAICFNVIGDEIQSILNPKGAVE